MVATFPPGVSIGDRQTHRRDDAVVIRFPGAAGTICRMLPMKAKATRTGSYSQPEPSLRAAIVTRDLMTELAI